MDFLRTVDQEISDIIHNEINRQQYEINLIASENYTHPAVLQALGSVLTNKYAEGYPGKRYYGGCTFVDQAEIHAQERCKELFKADHVNVQPHSGSQANMAVYTSILESGDTILGMSLASGGHLTHGHPVNISGRVYNAVQYGVRKDTECIDYDEVAELAHKHKPKHIIARASAYSRSIDFKRFKEIADSVGAYLLTDIAHIAGLVATGLHESPIPYADFVTSTTHKTLRGPRGGIIMCKAEHAKKIDKAIMPGTQGGPFMNTIASKAVAFKLAQQDDFVAYQKQVISNAQRMVSAFKDKGYRIVADGTDNHLFIVDMTSKGMNGKQAEHILGKAGISLSRSCIPFDTEKPWITSGIRIGTPAVTTKGFKEEDIIDLVEYIDQAFVIGDHTHKLELLKQTIQDRFNALTDTSYFVYI
jgi:glycine hydroxymethyltransferase